MKKLEEEYKGLAEKKNQLTEELRKTDIRMVQLQGKAEAYEEMKKSSEKKEVKKA